MEIYVTTFNIFMNISSKTIFMKYNDIEIYNTMFNMFMNYFFNKNK